MHSVSASLESPVNIYHLKTTHFGIRFSQFSHRRCEQKSIRIKRSKVKLHVEIAMPQVARWNLNHGEAKWSITKLKCVRLVRVASDLYAELGVVIDKSVKKRQKISFKKALFGKVNKLNLQILSEISRKVIVYKSKSECANSAMG